MLRIIIPILIFGTTIAGILLFINPLYKDIKVLKSEFSAHDEALTNSKKLETERDKLVNKYKSITEENLKKLDKLLPDGVDNIILILEIEKIALAYGMELKEIRYDTFTKNKVEGVGSEANAVKTIAEDNKAYGSWDLEFSVEGSYDKYLSFLHDLENNLRIVDISSVQFSSANTKESGVDIYKYSFKIRTYWLKD